ncbi:MAG: PAS domain-containing protein, partial [Candidatus Omnitrophica bacterium]|nr:PAS domain-containing protein [Candidatus Omnitrophota bacterium]
MKNEKKLNDISGSLEIYKRLINFTKDGVFSYTFGQGEIIFANQGLVDILGLDCSPQDLAGKKIEDIIEYIQEPGAMRKRLEKEGQVYNHEY